MTFAQMLVKIIVTFINSTKIYIKKKIKPLNSIFDVVDAYSTMYNDIPDVIFTVYPVQVLTGFRADVTH